ncbi:hypothetical protein FRB99_001841 [Tulasnella sp. 403]|nr:hypothetical protein FRB99_001841 [Tulasnella sp. 403]
MRLSSYFVASCFLLTLFTSAAPLVNNLSSLSAPSGYHTKRGLPNTQAWAKTLDEMDALSRQLANSEAPGAKAALDAVARARDEFRALVTTTGAGYNAHPLRELSWGYELKTILGNQAFIDGVKASPNQQKAIDDSYNALQDAIQKAKPPPANSAFYTMFTPTGITDLAAVKLPQFSSRMDVDPPRPTVGSDDDGDELIATIPIHLASNLAPNLHLHQFPLLTRPLEVPPSARISGKRLKARAKPTVGRYEIHVPVDMRPEVWNAERSKEYGEAREEEDAEERKAAGGDDGGKKAKKGKRRKLESDEEDEDEKAKNVKRLGEVRLKSERVTNKGDYFVGIMKDGRLHLHPISETHQFRPTLTYLDVLQRRAKPMVGDVDEEEDEEGGGAAQQSKPAGREVVVRASGGADANLGGLSALRRDIITTMRKEQEDKWVDLEWNDEYSPEAAELYGSMFAVNDGKLRCTTEMSRLLTSIKGLTSS